MPDKLSTITKYCRSSISNHIIFCLGKKHSLCQCRVCISTSQDETNRTSHTLTMTAYCKLYCEFVIDISLCVFRFLITFSPVPVKSEEPQSIVIFDIRTGQRKRGFNCETHAQATWPIFK